MTQYYVICSCPRSGSTLMARALEQMGAGRPDEYLNPTHNTTDGVQPRPGFMQPEPLAYIQRMIADNTIQGIFGLKTHYIHLARNPQIASQREALFPNAKYISITRRNILRQAISASIASQDDAWISTSPTAKKAKLSYIGVLKHLFILSQEIELWEAFYKRNGISPYRVVYEDLECNYTATMQGVASYLGLTADIPPEPIAKQADAAAETWIGSYCSLFRGNSGMARAARFLTRAF